MNCQNIHAYSLDLLITLLGTVTKVSTLPEKTWNLRNFDKKIGNLISRIFNNFNMFSSKILI